MGETIDSIVGEIVYQLHTRERVEDKSMLLIMHSGKLWFAHYLKLLETRVVEYTEVSREHL